MLKRKRKSARLYFLSWVICFRLFLSRFFFCCWKFFFKQLFSNDLCVNTIHLSDFCMKENIEFFFLICITNLPVRFTDDQLRISSLQVIPAGWSPMNFTQLRFNTLWELYRLFVMFWYNRRPHHDSKSNGLKSLRTGLGWST